MGKRKDINVRDFEKLCELQCTLIEVCAFFNCDDVTLNSWVKKNYDGKTFSDVFKVKRGLGKISLRRAQWRMAEFNPTMAIWLGKQYLDQRDKQEVDLNAQGNIVIDLGDLEGKEGEADAPAD